MRIFPIIRGDSVPCFSPGPCEQTGIMLLDNIAPVMHALTCMQEMPAPAPGTANRSEERIRGICDDDEKRLSQSPTASLPGDAAPARVTTGKKTSSKLHSDAVPDWIDFAGADDAADSPRGASTAAAAETKRHVDREEKAGKWEWNGYDYVWVVGAVPDRNAPDTGKERAASASEVDRPGRSINQPIVLEEAVEETAQLLHRSSSSSSLEQLAPSARKRTYGTAAVRSGGFGSDRGSKSSATSQDSTYSALVAPVASLLRASSTAAPLRAPSGFAARVLVKPRIGAGHPTTAKVVADRDAPAAALLVAADQQPASAVSGGGWRAKRKFASSS
jgi:hypothetical protein